jgi:hypothetical protein
MVKGLIFCLVLRFVFAAAIIDLPPAKISVDNVATTEVLQPWATSNDFIVGFIADTSHPTNVSVGVFKMGSNGQVTKIASRPATSRGKGVVYTNGQWFGAAEEELTVFQLDSGSVVDVTKLNHPALLMLPDGSMITYNEDTGLIGTLLHSAPAQWTLLEQTIYANLSVLYPMLPIWADNNTLIYHEVSGMVSFYKRNDDGGWTFEGSLDSETRTTTDIESYSLAYNGVDTVFLIAPVLQYPGATRYGHLLILTKVNDVWVRTVITADDLPVSQPYPYIGYNTYGVVNKDVFVAGTPYDKIPTTKRGNSEVPIGSMFFFQRQANNTWKTIAKTELDTPGYFGCPALITSSHVVTVNSGIESTNLGASATFYGIPTCNFEPADVTCVDGHYDSCGFDPLSVGAYVINDAADCGVVNATVAEQNSEGNTYTITFNFEKSFAASTTCTATWSCGSTPGATTPAKKTSAASVVSSVGVSMLVALSTWF